MSKKKSNLFEEHVDKAVLAIVSILSLVFLWVFVLSGPYAVEYDGKKFMVANDLTFISYFYRLLGLSRDVGYSEFNHHGTIIVSSVFSSMFWLKSLPLVMSLKLMR